MLNAAGVPVPRRHDRRRARGGEGAHHAAALCHQADRRRLQRRRLHRAGGPRASAAGADAPRLDVSARRCWSRSYIPGKELTCAVMGDKALGVIEIIADGTLLRLRGEICARRLETPAAGAGFTNCLPRVPTTVAGGASRAGLPRRHARRLPLRRQPRGDQGTGLPGSEYPARHDRNLAGARDCRACRHQLRRAGALDGRGRLAQPLKSDNARQIDTSRLIAAPRADLRNRALCRDRSAHSCRRAGVDAGH